MSVPLSTNLIDSMIQGGGPRVVVSTAIAFTPEFGVRFPVSAVWRKQKMFFPHPRVKVSIVGSLRDREVACSASDRQDSNFESCVWRTVSSQSSHHPQEVLLAQFSLYVHKGGLKPDSFHLTQWSLLVIVVFVEYALGSTVGDVGFDHYCYSGLTCRCTQYYVHAACIL